MIKILVIDDNKDSAESLAMMMELAGHEAKFVTSGVAALKKIGNFVPDVVLCDINMPELQGYEVCRKLRKDNRLESTIFIAQTAYNTIDKKIRSVDAGFHSHFVKPVNIGELLAFIDNALPKAE